MSEETDLQNEKPACSSCSCSRCGACSKIWRCFTVLQAIFLVCMVIWIPYVMIKVIPDIRHLASWGQKVESDHVSMKESIANLEKKEGQQSQNLIDNLQRIQSSISKLDDAVESLKSTAMRSSSTSMSTNEEELVQDVEWLYERGELFARPLRALIDRVKDNLEAKKICDTLLPMGSVMIKTLKDLRKDLESLQAMVYEAPSTQEKDSKEEKPSGWAMVLGRLKKMIHVQKIPTHPSDLENIRKVVQDSLAALDAVDLDKALECMTKLPEHQKRMFVSWIKDLEKRRDLDKAFQDFRQILEPKNVL